MIDLRKGDCLEIMQDIPEKSIDLILCDLPYGTTNCEWDIVIPFDPLWTQYKRITKDNAAILLFAQQPFATRLINSNAKHFRYEWVWQKTNYGGFLNSHKMPLRAHELILTFYKKLPVYNPQMRKGFKPYTRTRKPFDAGGVYSKHGKSETKSNGERFPIDVICFPNEATGNKNRLHPTQKPVALLEYFINTYTNEGAIVLDNCMGSGSTGIACVNTKRRFIGIEKDDHFFNIAKKRIGDLQNDRNRK